MFIGSGPGKLVLVQLLMHVLLPWFWKKKEIILFFFKKKYLYKVLNVLKNIEKYKEGKKPACLLKYTHS